MKDEIDLQALRNDMRALLKRYGLSPVSFGVVVTLTKHDFDALTADVPENQQQEIQIISENEPLLWFLQIMRQRTVEDFQKDLTPPPND